MEPGVNITVILDSQYADSDDDDFEVDSSDRIYAIVAVVVGIFVLQIVGLLICCKDRWMTKKEAKKNMEALSASSPTIPIEISEVLTTVRQPKKEKVPIEETANENEVTVTLLAEDKPQGLQSLADGNSDSQVAFVQVHETKGQYAKIKPREKIVQQD